MYTCIFHVQITYRHTANTEEWGRACVASLTTCMLEANATQVCCNDRDFCNESISGASPTLYSALSVLLGVAAHALLRAR